MTDTHLVCISVGVKIFGLCWEFSELVLYFRAQDSVCGYCDVCTVKQRLCMFYVLLVQEKKKHKWFNYSHNSRFLKNPFWTLNIFFFLLHNSEISNFILACEPKICPPLPHRNKSLTLQHLWLQNVPGCISHNWMLLGSKARRQILTSDTLSISSRSMLSFSLMVVHSGLFCLQSLRQEVKCVLCVYISNTACRMCTRWST